MRLDCNCLGWWEALELLAPLRHRNQGHTKCDIVVTINPCTHRDPPPTFYVVGEGTDLIGAFRLPVLRHPTTPGLS